MLSFFSGPLHPTAFHPSKSNFIGTYCSNWRKFCITTTTGSRSVVFQQLFVDRNFFGELLPQKFELTRFLEGKGCFFEACLYSKLGNAKGFPITDGTLFSWPVGHDSFHHLFSLNFVKEMNFLKFFETNSTFPIAHCVSQFLRSSTTSEQWLGDRMEASISCSI